MQEFVHWADRDPIGKDDLILTCMSPEKEAIFRTYLETHVFPPLLLYGTPGLGKSTAARLLSEFDGTDVQMLRPARAFGTILTLSDSDEAHLEEPDHEQTSESPVEES